MCRTALTVHGFNLEAPLSPFFVKARCILIFQPWLILQPGQVFQPEELPLSLTRNCTWTRDWVCQAIADADVERAICGFIDSDSLYRLRYASIDVRLGPCSKPAMDLVAEFSRLPRP